MSGRISHGNGFSSGAFWRVLDGFREYSGNAPSFRAWPARDIRASSNGPDDNPRPQQCPTVPAGLRGRCRRDAGQQKRAGGTSARRAPGRESDGSNHASSGPECRARARHYERSRLYRPVGWCDARRVSPTSSRLFEYLSGGYRACEEARESVVHESTNPGNQKQCNVNWLAAKQK